MSRNAFPRLEIEYNEREARLDEIRDRLKKDRAPTFADLIRECEAHFERESIAPLAMIGNDNLRDLLQCIREQQSALAAIVEMDDRDEMHIESIYESAFDQARAVLQKWRIE